MKAAVARKGSAGAPAVRRVWRCRRCGGDARSAAMWRALRAGGRQEGGTMSIRLFGSGDEPGAMLAHAFKADALPPARPMEDWPGRNPEVGTERSA